MTKIIRKKRKFIANKKTNLTVTSVGRIKLRKNEHFSINFMDKVNDVCAMSWGLYATSSINKNSKSSVSLSKRNRAKHTLSSRSSNGSINQHVPERKIS